MPWSDGGGVVIILATVKVVGPFVDWGGSHSHDGLVG